MMKFCNIILIVGVYRCPDPDCRVGLTHYGIAGWHIYGAFGEDVDLAGGRSDG